MSVIKEGYENCMKAKAGKFNQHAVIRPAINFMPFFLLLVLTLKF